MADKIAPYCGGAVTAFGLTGRGSGLSVDESIAIWLKLAGLADTPVTYRYPHLQPNDPTTATRLTWGPDPTELQVELLRVDGGGHTGSSRTEDLTWLLRKLMGDMNHDEDTSEAAWHFFGKKRAQVIKPWRRRQWQMSVSGRIRSETCCRQATIDFIYSRKASFRH